MMETKSARMPAVKLPIQYADMWESLQDDMEQKGLPVELRPNLGLMVVEAIEEVIARWEEYPEEDNDRMTTLFREKTERRPEWKRI